MTSTGGFDNQLLHKFLSNKFKSFIVVKLKPRANIIIFMSSILDHDCHYGSCHTYHKVILNVMVMMSMVMTSILMTKMMMMMMMTTMMSMLMMMTMMMLTMMMMMMMVIMMVMMMMMMMRNTSLCKILYFYLCKFLFNI